MKGIIKPYIIILGLTNTKNATSSLFKNDRYEKTF